MEIGINEKNQITLKKVYDPICLETKTGDEFFICEREGKLEFKMKEGEVYKICGNTKIPEKL